MISATSGDATWELAAADQVGDVERAHVRAHDVSSQQGHEGRQPADTRPDAGRGGGQPGHLGLGKPRDREDDDVDPLGRRDLQDVGQPAEHGEVANPALAGVVVEEAHGTQPEVVDSLQVPRESLACCPRSDDEGPEAESGPGAADPGQTDQL